MLMSVVVMTGLWRATNKLLSHRLPNDPVVRQSALTQCDVCPFDNCRKTSRAYIVRRSLCASNAVNVARHISLIAVHCTTIYYKLRCYTYSGSLRDRIAHQTHGRRTSTSEKSERPNAQQLILCCWCCCWSCCSRNHQRHIANRLGPHNRPG